MLINGERILKTIGRAALVGLVALSVLGGCASTGVVPTGQDVFMLAKTGGAPGMSGAEVTADLYREANAFFTQKHRQMETIKVTEHDWRAFVRMASSKLEFRCVASL